MPLPRDNDTNVKEARELLHEVSTLRTRILVEEAEAVTRWLRLHPTYQASARNLLHYISLRQYDIRPLQERLAALGLSSLGRSEAHVLSTLNAILCLLHLLSGKAAETPELPPATERTLGYAEGQELLEAHTQTLLGPTPPHRHVRIMVTMSTEAAENYELVRSLLASGMDCMRINCAHDDAPAWARMVAHLRRAEAELGRECRILMDLAGPKLRTGPVESKPSRLKWKPHRKHSGLESVPARIWLSPAGSDDASQSADAVVPVTGHGFDLLQPGDILAFRNAAETWYDLVIIEKAEGGYWATCAEKASVTSGTPFQFRRTASADSAVDSPVDLQVAELPPVEHSIRLRRGDTLVLTRDASPGKPAEYNAEGSLLHPAHIPCLPADILSDIQAGERIWLDDG
ncbi:MAG TPA: pyruvate kinase, partial [Chthonomonadaceae bacterium]|nr:pyruvate kinase [Chthonomonadaceae bacterium]